MYYIALALLCVVMSGCTRYAQPATPEEQVAQEQMMRNVLNDSSPRNMNEHPKVTDEFKRTFTTNDFGNTNGSQGSGSSSSNEGSQDNKQSQGQTQNQTKTKSQSQGQKQAPDVPLTKQSEDDEESWW